MSGCTSPDSVAPGAQLVSTVSSSSTLYQNSPYLLTDTVGGAGATGYMRFSGTSMAAAVTTGVVAQMIQANRSRPTRSRPSCNSRHSTWPGPIR